MKPMPRKISWIKPALKAVQRFPASVQREIATALAIAAAGEKSDIAKPMKGMGAGVLEIALKHHRDAYRAVYAVKIGKDVWVLHAFQKKSKTGIKTPKEETDVIRERLKRLKEELQ